MGANFWGGNILKLLEEGVDIKTSPKASSSF
jgi:hypothetical protein